MASVPLPVIASAAAPEQEVRPSPLHLLPFRVVHSLGYGPPELEYEAEVQVPSASGGVRVLPFRQSSADGPGPAILRLVGQYRELEATLDPVMKERDMLRDRVQELERQLGRTEQALTALRRQQQAARKEAPSP
jgi:hypothetical protein